MSVAPKEQAPKITRNSLAVATWALFGLAVIFYVARLAVRWRTSRRLYFDDAWATGAFILLLVHSVILTLAIFPMYEVLNVGAGIEQPTEDFMADGSYYLKLQFAMSILYWSCLWCVKGCFLAFFRRLTNGLKWCRWAWWGIVGFTVLSYSGCIITYPISCSSFVINGCESERNKRDSATSLRFSTAVDILTDAMIIALPLYLAYRVQLPLPQKCALGGVFSLGIVIMVFAVARIIVTSSGERHPEVSWLALWSQIEASAAVVVSSLAPFKTFFAQRKSRSYQSGNSPKKIYAISWWNRSHRRGQSGGVPAVIPLEGRSGQHTVHQNGTIGLEDRDTESMERTLGRREKINFKAML